MIIALTLKIFRLRPVTPPLEYLPIRSNTANCINSTLQPGPVVLSQPEHLNINII